MSMQTSSNILPPEFDMIRRNLLQAGRDNVSTRTIVNECQPHKIPHDEVLDPDLQLKLLHIAAWTGDVSTIRELKTENLADPAAQTAGGFTPVHLAASRGHSDALSELLGWPTVNVKGAISVEGFTALHLAAYGGHTKSVELLLPVSDVNVQDGVFGRSALHFAAQGGHDEVVDLLTRVPDIDVRSKDSVRHLTPLLLAARQPKGGCSVRLVKMLLQAKGKRTKANAKATAARQIKDKVGTLRRHVEHEIVDQFFRESWRRLAAIEIDNSMKPTPGVDDDVDKAEVDMYRRFAVPVEGHNALHLAATQNNAELVSHLVSRTGVLLNEGDTEFGMTPLHCAIRTGAMDAFSALMLVDKLDVNAKLVKTGSCQRPSWLLPASAFTGVKETELSEFICFQLFDTPLHLAIRVCPAETLPGMVIKFCNHPTFNPAIYNDEGWLSLHVAWSRLSYCAEFPSLLQVLRTVSTYPELQLEKYQYEDRVYLNRAIDVLKSHPANALVMNGVAEMRKAAQDSVNAFLVTATLLAGLTFSAYLQPPFGTDVGNYKSKPARLFWIFNSLAFYFAVYTILDCLLYILRSDRSLDEIYNLKIFVAIIRIQNAVPLTVSVAFGIGAFVAAGYANLPPESKSLMLACTISGLLLVLFQLFRNMYVAYSTLKEALIHRDETFRRRDYVYLWCFMFMGGPITLPLMYSVYLKKRTTGRIRPLKGKTYQYPMNIAFVGIQMYGVVGMVLFAVLEVLT